MFAALLAAGLGASAGGSGQDARRSLVALAFEAGFGQALTLAIAALFAVVAAAHIVKGAKAGFLKYVRLPTGSAGWLTRICQFGLIARGVTFLIIAWLIASGAASYRSGDLPGIEAALGAMAGWRFGWLALAVTGAGLVAFGLYAFVEAGYRRIDVDDRSARHG